MQIELLQPHFRGKFIFKKVTPEQFNQIDTQIKACHAENLSLSPGKTPSEPCKVIAEANHPSVEVNCAMHHKLFSIAEHLGIEFRFIPDKPIFLKKRKAILKRLVKIVQTELKKIPMHPSVRFKVEGRINGPYFELSAPNRDGYNNLSDALGSLVQQKIVNIGDQRWEFENQPVWISVKNVDWNE